MAINFPDSPNVNDNYTVGTTTWTWDGTSWSSSAQAYTLPVATNTVLGGVKQGTNVTIDADGVISAAFVLGTATTADLGGVKIDGTTITIDANGVISSTASGDVTKAANSTDDAIVRFNGTTGDTLDNSLVTISDTGVITAPSVGSVIPFYFANQASFPVAGAANHGAIAHSHADEKMYFSHGGAWNALMNEPVRTTETKQTSAAHATNTTENLTFTTLGLSYFLYTVEVSHAAWVRIYTDTTSQTADAGRAQGTDPAEGSGVIAEFISGTASTYNISPALVGYVGNSETTVPVSVTNLTAGTVQITVDITVLKIEG